MIVSTGVVLGIIGLISFVASLWWFVSNYYKKKSTKMPVIVLMTSLALCVIGYVVTPTGIANVRLVINQILN